MKPITIRYYGLIPIRKQTYLVLQSIVLVLCGVWLIVGLFLIVWKPGRWDYLLVLGVVATAAEILDTIFTLRAFRRKEEEEKTRLEAGLASEPRHEDTNIK